MSRVRVASFSISLDGFGAGPDQSLENPLGVGGMGLHEWAFKTDTFQKMFGGGAGAKDVGDQFAARGFENIGAWILGRNMFATSRGPWVDDGWQGWWGDNPPYHVPVFVLTHHPRAPLQMQGGTTFYFVTGGIDDALAQAKAAAGEKDVRIGGGVQTIRQYLQAGLIDELHIAIAPVLLGSGELCLPASICLRWATNALSTRRQRMRRTSFCAKPERQGCKPMPWRPAALPAGQSQSGLQGSARNSLFR